MVAMVVFLNLFAVFIAAATGKSINVTINTPAGTFIGFKTNVSADGSTVEVSKFLGIPYAEPPIRELRFQKPVMKAVLSKPLVVQQHGAECIKLRTPGNDRNPKSEDCLFLNIYAPNTTESAGSLAVMVWIHGGGYVSGSSNAYDAGLLAARGNVIIVTFNYRLSVLGFLNVGGGKPSNFGLWDQHLAIKWVNENIGAFGGDKDRITLFGESAGAGSAIFQGLYPGNRGRFQRIIAQSGSASNPALESLDPIAEAKEFASVVGCDNSNTDKLLECLKSIPGESISNTLADVTNNLFRIPSMFLPSVDNDFVKVSPSDILNSNLDVASNERNVFASFDVMMGTNSGEGAFNVNPLFGIRDMNSFRPNRTFFENTLIPACIRTHQLKGDTDMLTKFVISIYTSWDDPENPYEIREKYVEMYTEIGYTIQCLKTIGVHSQYSTHNTYMYYFMAVPSTHLVPTPNWTHVANHGDDMQYLFGESLALTGLSTSGANFQPWEDDLSKRIMTMWSNFAKSGNPNQPRDIGLNWQPFTQANQMYLEIGPTLNTTINKENLIERNAYVWNTLLPAVNKVVSSNLGPCNQDTSGCHSFSDWSPWFMMFLIIAATCIQRFSV